MTAQELAERWRDAVERQQSDTCTRSMTSIETDGVRHRWRCTCGKFGEWKTKIGSARGGATKHVTRQGWTKDG